MEYEVRSHTTKSNHHKKNEDCHFICDDYIIVADGMGGESDGDVASRIAVESIDSVLSQNLADTYSDTDIKELSNKAIYSADSKINEYIERHPDSFGMGTTILLAIMKDNKLFISWCGDSHCYSYRNGKVVSITKDHSYVQELIDSGEITIDESFTHPDNNMITRFVGGGEDACKPDFIVHQITDSEIIILCSDGLSGYCKQKDIEHEITNNPQAESLPEQLTMLAKAHGSDDDITIVILAHKMQKNGKKTNSMFRWLTSLIHP